MTNEPGTTVSVETMAQHLGVVDALVFRRISESTWAHLGGLGRGRGWAGLVEVDDAADQLLLDLPASPGDVRTFSHPQSERVLGPYYAVGGALVRLSHDVVVVLGHPSRPLAADATDDDLRRLAERFDRDLEDIAPSKRLGDELEVLHALRQITTAAPTNLIDTLQHVVDVARPP